MERPIGVAWLYEQLEETVKRELGLEKQLAAAEVQNALLQRVAEAARMYMKQRTTAHRRELRDALAAWDAAQRRK